MVKEKEKNERPSCACGKTDLYQEWKKNNEQVTSESKKEANKTAKKAVKSKNEKD